MVIGVAIYKYICDHNCTGRIYAISTCHSLGKIKIQKNPAIKDWITENKKMVGVRGFEPPTFASRTQRSNQAEPHPDKIAAYNILHTVLRHVN